MVSHIALGLPLEYSIHTIRRRIKMQMILQLKVDWLIPQIIGIISINKEHELL